MPNQRFPRRSPLAASLLVTLLIAAPAGAAVFTAGPGGAYGTLAEAVNAALAAPGQHEVRAGQGQYDENLVINVTTGTQLKITGGWNTDFSARSQNPALTVLDGGSLDSVLWAEVGAGATLELNTLLLRFGRATRAGGGARLFLKGGTVRLLKCHFVDNLVEAAENGEGGGIAATVQSGGNLILKNSLLRGNLVRGTDARGGGLSLSGVAATGSPAARFTVSTTRFENNVAEVVASAQLARGGAFDVRGTQAINGKILDNTVRDNGVRGPEGGNVIELSAFDGPVFEFRRNSVLGGDDATEPARVTLVSVISDGGSRVTLSDSLVARGAGGGLRGFAYDGGTLRLTNLTVADNAGTGLYANQSSAAVLSVANSITHGNGANLQTVGTVAVVSHLGSDPRFRNRGNNDYRLGTRSLAANSGTNTPPGGLGAQDLARTARIKSRKVDRGAYESF